MAKVNGMFGTRLSGKLGNMVFYQFRGKDCMRSLSAKAHKEGTPNQVLQRKRFSAMVKFAKQFRFVLIPQIWNQAGKNMTGINFFIKTNSVAFNTEGIITDPRLVQLSAGKLHLPGDMITQRMEDDPSAVSIKWQEGFYSGGIPFWDELLMVSYADGLYSDIQYTGIRRGDLQGIAKLPELDVPATHVYLFFMSLDKAKYSPSICIALN